MRYVELFLIGLLVSACSSEPGSQGSEAETGAKTTPSHANRDCSEAYGGQPASCEVVACLPRYQEFIGTWEGPFEAFDQDLDDFRPYRNEVTYSESDCLRNVGNDDVFIIGRRTDTYPEYGGKPSEVKTGLLITGVDASGNPFLKTTGDEGVHSYEMQFKNNAASMAIWSLSISDNGTPMTFTTIDGRDWTTTDIHKRNVVVTMTVGEASNPAWEGVIARGYHSLTSK